MRWHLLKMTTPSSRLGHWLLSGTDHARHRGQASCWPSSFSPCCGGLPTLLMVLFVLWVIGELVSAHGQTTTVDSFGAPGGYAIRTPGKPTTMLQPDGRGAATARSNMASLRSSMTGKPMVGCASGRASRAPR